MRLEHFIAETLRSINPTEQLSIVVDHSNETTYRLITVTGVSRGLFLRADLCISRLSRPSDASGWSYSRSSERERYAQTVCEIGSYIGVSHLKPRWGSPYALSDLIGGYTPIYIEACEGIGYTHVWS